MNYSQLAMELLKEQRLLERVGLVLPVLDRVVKILKWIYGWIVGCQTKILS
ncbi:MAG: hypothetical protein ACMUIU_19595 [bacterium]